MTLSEREALVDRLVKASGDPAYRAEAEGWSDDNLVAWLDLFEQAAEDVRRHGHLAADWIDSGRPVAG